MAGHVAAAPPVVAPGAAMGGHVAAAPPGAARLKQPLNAYQIWAQGIRADANAYNQVKHDAEDKSAKGIMKTLASRWSQLSAAEKGVFEQEASRRTQEWRAAKRASL